MLLGHEENRPSYMLLFHVYINFEWPRPIARLLFHNGRPRTIARLLLYHAWPRPIARLLLYHA